MTRKTGSTCNLVMLNLVGLGVSTLLTSSVLQVWFFEIFVSFAPKLVLTSLAAYLFSAAYFFVSSWRQKTVSFPSRAYLILPLVGVVSLLAFFTFRFNNPGIDVTGSQNFDLVVATYNKHIVEPEIDKAVDLFIELDVDILFLQETTPKETADFARRLSFEHTYSTDNRQDIGDTDVAIISRYELEDREAIRAIPERRQSILKAVVEVDSQQVALYTTHLNPSVNSRKYDFRNRELGVIENLLAEESLPIIFGGDLNTTNYSPALREFEKNVAGNNIGSTTQGLLPTCTWSGMGSVLCLRVDHVYVSNEFELTSAELSPQLESDHRAVILKLAI